MQLEDNNASDETITNPLSISTKMQLEDYEGH